MVWNRVFLQKNVHFNDLANNQVRHSLGSLNSRFSRTSCVGFGSVGLEFGWFKQWQQRHNLFLGGLWPWSILLFGFLTNYEYYFICFKSWIRLSWVHRMNMKGFSWGGNFFFIPGSILTLNFLSKPRVAFVSIWYCSCC